MERSIRQKRPYPITAEELRSKYLNFFRERGHAVIPSASVIPENDPSVLFTTAGMHPLIPYLLGRPHPAGRRLVDAQKCIRTTDIDEVGDESHLTFFEMLGNWSLGDYFKQESITWSWEFVTGPEYLAIEPHRIHVSVFAGDQNAPRDDESAEIWRSLGVPDERINYLSAEHNWWAAGDEGPCGPDTEIFVDLTGTPCEREADCVAGLCECGRFFEVWNNVFMTYNRTAATLTRLPTHNVDTGMGLERTLAVLNGAATVYETSAFQPLIRSLASRSAHSYEEIVADSALTRAMRVVSDHLRAAVFILGDERAIAPSNQGQGYVLRRLIRRAVRFCEPLGIDPAAWATAAQVVVDQYGDAYPELRENGERIHRELTMERERFQKALGKGTELLLREIGRLQSAGAHVLSGEVAFRLYDTYGFPIEFTQELARERRLDVDLDDFQRRFAEHRERSRSEAARSGLADQSDESIRYHTAPTCSTPRSARCWGSMFSRKARTSGGSGCASTFLTPGP